MIFLLQVIIPSITNLMLCWSLYFVIMYIVYGYVIFVHMNDETYVSNKWIEKVTWNDFRESLIAQK